MPSAEFRRNGPVWQLRWDGVTVHVPDAKGLRDLHSLLGLPGTDVPAVQLLAPEGGDLVVAAGQLGGDPVLDEEAKRRYKEHLARLDAEIDRAAARDDARGSRNTTGSGRPSSTSSVPRPGSAAGPAGWATRPSGPARRSPPGSATPCASWTPCTPRWRPT